MGPGGGEGSEIHGKVRSRWQVRSNRPAIIFIGSVGIHPRQQVASSTDESFSEVHSQIQFHGQASPNQRRGQVSVKGTDGVNIFGALHSIKLECKSLSDPIVHQVRDITTEVD